MAERSGAPSRSTQPGAVPATRQGAGTATQSTRQGAGAATQSTRPVAAAILSTQPEAQTASPFAQPTGPIEVDVRPFIFFFSFSLFHSSIHSSFPFFLPAFPLKPFHVCEDRRRRKGEDRGTGRVKLLSISTVFP